MMDTPLSQSENSSPSGLLIQQSELNALEAKVDQVITRCGILRSENRNLLETISRLNAENRRLDEKIAAACARLEKLLNQLPADF